MHVSIEGPLPLCGFDPEDKNWQKQWMDSKKADTLPICSMCLLKYKDRFGRDFSLKKLVPMTRNDGPTPVMPDIMPTREGPEWLWKPGLTLSRVPNA
jgi:hypothetical protein